MKNNSQIRFVAAALILSLSAVLLHVYDVSEVPGGFFYDESSVAYNAYCISETGSDEYGNRLPLFFRCFDNFQDPVYIYTLVPLVSVFGAEKWVARLPGVLYKLAASAALFFLLMRLTSMRWISLFAAFAFAVLPWTFVLGRTGIGGYMPMLLGLILFVHFFIAFMERDAMAYAIFAGLAWAFAMYSHQIGRPMAALILFAFVLAYNAKMIGRRRCILIFSATVFVAMVPMMMSVAGTPESLTKRFSTFSIWRDGAGIFVVIGRFLSRYIEYFSPQFLFISGDIELRHNTDASGELYLVMAPFLLLGLWRLIKSFRRSPTSRFILLALAAYPVAASLTLDRFHSTRCLNGAPFFCILAALGLKTALSMSRKRRVKFKWRLLVALLFSMEIGAYLWNYFGGYAEKARAAFNAPLVETIEAAFRERKENETIYVSSSLFHHPVDEDFKPVWYSHFLFFGKIDPARYQSEGIPPEIVSHYNPKVMPPSGLLLRMNSKIVFDRNYNSMVVLNDEPLPDGTVLLSRIPLVAGSDRFFEVYRF